MVRSKILQGKVLALASVMCLMAGIVSAQEPDETGIVHITDIASVAAQNKILRTNCDKAAACGVGGTCENGGSGQGNCRSCQNGCQTCPGGYGCGTCNLCPFGGCNSCNSCCANLSMPVRRLIAWANPCSGVCSYSPMHGFTPPSKRPYFRQPISYQHNYPAKWVGGVPSGYAGHRPAVYTPTDTTQLGYYYQKVPTWVPVPGMIPRAPHPSQLHYYGPTTSSYPSYASCPTQYAPTEAGEAVESNQVDETEAAPLPPTPEPEEADLERSVSNPNLLPIVR